MTVETLHLLHTYFCSEAALLTVTGVVPFATPSKGASGVAATPSSAGATAPAAAACGVGMLAPFRARLASTAFFRRESAASGVVVVPDVGGSASVSSPARVRLGHPLQGPGDRLLVSAAGVVECWLIAVV